MEDMVNRLEKEMGLLDFQNSKVIDSQVEVALPREAVSLREALSYSGVVYLKGGHHGGSHTCLGPTNSAMSSFPSLDTAAAVLSNYHEPICNIGDSDETLLTKTKVKICRSEFCCPWSGQVRHARHVTEKPTVLLAPIETTYWPATAAAAADKSVKPVSSSGSVWSNLMPIPPRLVSAVVSGSNTKAAGERGVEYAIDKIKTKGGSDSNLSTKSSKKRSLGRLNIHFEKVRMKKKGKHQK